MTSSYYNNVQCVVLDMKLRAVGVSTPEFVLKYAHQDCIVKYYIIFGNQTSDLLFIHVTQGTDTSLNVYSPIHNFY